MRFGDLGVAQVHGVFIPHGAELDPTEAEIVGNDVTNVIEVLRDLIVDDGDFEWRLRHPGHAGERSRSANRSGHARTPEEISSCTAFHIAPFTSARTAVEWTGTTMI